MGNAKFLDTPASEDGASKSTVEKQVFEVSMPVF